MVSLIYLCNHTTPTERMSILNLKIILLMEEKMIWYLIPTIVSMVNKKHHGGDMKSSKTNSNKETVIRVRIIHASLFPRNLSLFYVWMTFQYGTSHIHTFTRFLGNSRMMELNIIGNFLREGVFLNFY